MDAGSYLPVIRLSFIDRGEQHRRSLGLAPRAGMLLAEKRINERGGIKGRPIKILIEDDGSKPDIAKSKAEALIHGEKVVALLGPSLTASTGAVASVTNSIKMPQLCMTGLGPAIESSYKSLFHMLPPQQLNARAMLEYIAKELKMKKLGVLHDSGYGQLVMTHIQKVHGEYGIEIVAAEKFEVAATDVSTQAAKVRAAQPDVVGVIATSPVPFRNARQVRITQPIVSAVGSSSYEYVKGMGEFADDIVFAEFIVAEDPLPHQKEFVEYYLTHGAKLSKEVGYVPLGKQHYDLAMKNFKAKKLGTGFGGKAARAPVCCAVRRLGVQSLRDQLCHSFVIDRARPPWSKLVIQPWEPIPRIPRAPLVDRVAIDPQCRRNVSAGLVRPFACQDDARAQRQRCWK